MNNTHLNGLRFALYVRKSTESEDRQMQSIGDQISKLEELAQKEGLNVIRTYKESKSAKAPRKRPQFNQILEDVRSGEIDGILCWALNRLSRNNVDSSEIQWELQEGSLSCIKTPEKEYLPNDSGLLFTLESAMSTEFIRDLRKNINRGMQSKLDKGILPCLPPLGYVNCPRTKTIIPDEKYFPLVRKMWDLMLTGTYTPPKLVEYVNKEWGFKTPMRKKIGGTPLSRSSLYKMFQNEFYKGVITWNGEKYKGIHEKLVTPEEFERVQELIGKRAKTSERKREFAYTGIIRCGECGCLITAEEKKKKLKDGSLNYHRYYHCTGKSKYQVCSQKKCTRVKNLEDQIEKKLLSIKIIPEFKDFALEVIKDKHKEEVQNRAVIEDHITTSIKSTQSNLDNLIDLRVRNLLTDDEFLNRKSSLSIELGKLKQKRSETEDRAQNWRDIAEQTCNFALYAIANFENGDCKKRKEILLSLGQNLLLENQELTLGINSWLQPIIDEQENIVREFKRLEPLKNRSLKGENGLSMLNVPSWYTRRDSNPRHPVPKTGALSS